VPKGGEIVYAGGAITTPAVSAGGLIGIAPGIKVSGMVVGTGVTFFVSSGATASATTLRNGTEIVSAGGVVAGTVTMSGISDLSVAGTTGIALTLSGFATGDLLRLADFQSMAAEKLTFVENGAKTRGVLTVTDGQLSATITLFGQYVAAGFHTMPDGSIGSVIQYNPISGAHQGLAAKP